MGFTTVTETVEALRAEGYTVDDWRSDRKDDSEGLVNGIGHEILVTRDSFRVCRNGGSYWTNCGRNFETLVGFLRREVDFAKPELETVDVWFKDEGDFVDVCPQSPEAKAWLHENGLPNQLAAYGDEFCGQPTWTPERDGIYKVGISRAGEHRIASNLRASGFVVREG